MLDSKQFYLMHYSVSRLILGLRSPTAMTCEELDRWIPLGNPAAKHQRSRFRIWVDMQNPPSFLTIKYPLKLKLSTRKLTQSRPRQIDQDAKKVFGLTV